MQASDVESVQEVLGHRQPAERNKENGEGHGGYAGTKSLETGHTAGSRSEKGATEGAIEIKAQEERPKEDQEKRYTKIGV